MVRIMIRFLTSLFHEDLLGARLDSLNCDSLRVNNNLVRVFQVLTGVGEHVSLHLT